MVQNMQQRTHDIEWLERRREELVEGMLAIGSMCRGTISEQFVKVHHKGKKEPVERGPYYVLSCWKEGRNQSRRIPPDELERTRADLANHERFLGLCREFEEVTEQLGQLTREGSGAAERLKKGLKSRSSRARK